MTSKYAKLDSGLKIALVAYREESVPAGQEEAGISATLTFTGDIGEIIPLGFETFSVRDGKAVGIVRFRDIDRLIAHPNVTRIACGTPKEADVNTAAFDVKARSTTQVTAGPTATGLWHAVVATGAFSSAPKATGKGVIVAVIDTGIDYEHPMFMSALSPFKTRILRIWDQGLTPAKVDDGPPEALLESAFTYGSEFKDRAIDAALNGGAPLKHRDCSGHGTHVAGIAAGGTVFPPSGDAKHVGIAPEASIIAVKYLDTPKKIYYKKVDDGLSTDDVSWKMRFRDAVLYCLRTAQLLNKPIVLNMSFGDNSQPGDGLDEDARFVDGLLAPGGAPSAMRFPSGAIVAKAAGNMGIDGFGNNFRIARIEVPNGPDGVIVPIRVIDARGEVQTRRVNCENVLVTSEVSAHFWYRRTPAPAAVRFALQLPHETGFGAEVSVGGELERGYLIRQTTPRSYSFVSPSKSVFRVGLEHKDPGVLTPPGGGTVHRHHVKFYIKPKITGTTVSYNEGIYLLRIKAPPGTEIFFYGGIRQAGSIGVVCRIATSGEFPGLNSAAITFPTTHRILDPLGQYVITVGSYNEKPPPPVGDFPPLERDPAVHEIALSSSLGPLRDFSVPAGSVALIPKPDIAAPGHRINSAHSKHTANNDRRNASWRAGVRFQSLSGTSMAAPMVAGLVAMMLEKNPSLTTTQVQSILAAAARPGGTPAPGAANHTEAFGAGMIDALVSHGNTP